jgi:hypothetical protein
MRTATISYEIYQYNELSDEAKEVVKKWWLDGQDSYGFTEDVKEDLKCLFGDNDLDVQYQLSYCQGDGFNISGKVDTENIFKCLEEHRAGEQLAEFENYLTEKEKKTILHYASVIGGKIKLPINSRYGYSMAEYIDVADEWEYDLEYYSGYSNINKKALEKFETLVRGIFSTLCKSYEKWGYEYFYEIDEETMEELCEANGYEFLANGKIF